MRRNNLDKNVRKWYSENYPTDDLVNEIDEFVTFTELGLILMARQNFYEAVGNGIDSVIRERIFSKLSEELSVEYDLIYSMWLSAAWLT